MKIQELLLEFEIPDAVKNFSLGNVFGKNITAGDVSSALPNVSAVDVISTGKKAYDIASTKLFDIPGVGPYTIADAAIDVPLLVADLYTFVAVTPAIIARFSTKVAANLGEKELASIAARKGTQAVSTNAEKQAAGIAAADKKAVKAGVGREATHGVANQIGQNVSVSQGVKDIVGGLGKKTPGGSQTTATPGKKRRSVGEVIPVPVGGKQFNLPIVKVLPSSGYTVDASKVPGKKPGETIDAPEPEDKL